MTASEFAALLQARRTGKGRWIAKCPAHPDRTPSLAIVVGRKVPVLIKCMSQGCDTKSVLEALGLRWADLFDGIPLRYDRETLNKLRLEKSIDDLKQRRREILHVYMENLPRVPRSTWGDAKDPDEFIRNGGDYRKALDFTGPWWKASDIPGYVELTEKMNRIADKLNPERIIARERSLKTYKFVEKHGWDKIWDLWLKTDAGRAAEQQYGRQDGTHSTAGSTESGADGVRSNRIYDRPPQLPSGGVWSGGEEAIRPREFMAAGF